MAPPPGDTLWQQSRFIAADETLRRFVLDEPRGGVFRHVNLLVPPEDPRAQMGWIIMEPADTPPMSGSNCICVATVLLETGILPMAEPEARLVLEAPGGLVEVTATCRDGKVKRVALRNLPSFADRLSVPLEGPGLPNPHGRHRLWWGQLRDGRVRGARAAARPRERATSPAPSSARSSTAPSTR